MSKKIIVANEFTQEMVVDHGTLLDFLSLVEKGKPWQIRTDLLLRLNGNTRRGKNVNSSIQALLKERGLVCTPQIEVADYYGSVVVSDPRDLVDQREAIAAMPISAFHGDYPELIYAGKDMAAKKVETLMIKDDFSQIPVLSQDRKTLYGVVTWQSLARFQGDLRTAKASDVTVQGQQVVASSDDFLNLVDAIVEKDFVLYRDPDGAIAGIVTSSDLAQAFNEMSGIYILLGEVEDRLRVLLDRSPLPTLQRHLEPNRQSMKNFRGATDMMFGEYLRALNDPEVWHATGIDLDQEVCMKLLRAVKQERNKAMHFNSEVDTESLEAVRQVLRILRGIPLNLS